jgi:hypothetical protein
MAIRKKPKAADKASSSEHTIPGPVSSDVLKNVVLKRSSHEERAIQEYVEWQAPAEHVVHLEKVATERLFERKLDAWDVRTDKSRYWVITTDQSLLTGTLSKS